MMVPALILYLPMASIFQITHEGWRLNHPFLFLGLFALTCAMRGHARGWIGGVAAVAVATMTMGDGGQHPALNQTKDTSPAVPRIPSRDQQFCLVLLGFGMVAAVAVATLVQP